HASDGIIGLRPSSGAATCGRASGSGLVQDVPMWQLVDAWKGCTAKQANKILGCKGQFWQDGYRDTYMRDGAHESRTRRYIENNPMKAKLVASPTEWPWCSARFRDAYERLCIPGKCRGAPVLGRSEVAVGRTPC